MKDYKCYIFDFDGTIMDTIGYLRPLYIHSFKQVGIDVSEEQIQMFFTQSITKTFQMMNVTQEQAKIIANYAVEQRANKDFLSGTKPYQDALTYINHLKGKGKDIAIISGNDSVTIKLMLEVNGIDPSVFLSILGMYDFKEQKPSAEPINEFLRRHPQFKKNEIVYIGDGIQDKNTAENAGIDYILVNRGYLKDDTNVVSSLIALI